MKTTHQVSNCLSFFCFWLCFGWRLRSGGIGRGLFLWAPLILYFCTVRIKWFCIIYLSLPSSEFELLQRRTVFLLSLCLQC